MCDSIFDKYQNIKNFDDVYKITKIMNNTKDIGDLFEKITYYLFKLDPKLNAGLKSIWMYSDIPTKKIKKLNLPSNDKGIDILAKINGEYCAIQCKYRQDPYSKINWRSLATFFGITFGINNKIKKGYFVTNTYNLCHEIIKSDKVIAIYGNYFDNLPIGFFEAIYTGNDKINYMRKYPHTYQKQCVTESLINFLDNRSGYMEMVCEPNKTLTSYWIDKAMGNKITVIFVSSMYLVTQYYIDWFNQSHAENKKINYLIVGSDAHSNENIQYKSNGFFLFEDSISTKKQLQSIDLKEKTVIICRYQNSYKLSQICGIDIKISFAIFHESRKNAGQTNKNFELVFDNKNIIIRNSLFIAETPKIYLEGLEKENIMGNESIYGKMFYRYSMTDVIRDKKLVDYQIIFLHVKNKDINKIITDNDLLKHVNDFDDKTIYYIGTILLILKIMHDNRYNHLVTCHNITGNIQKFSNTINTINKILYKKKFYVNYLDSKCPIEQRNKIIKEFSNAKKAIICYPKVLNEEINIPKIDSICFVDQCDKKINIIQCISTSLRVYPGKKQGHVIVPNFMDNFNDDITYATCGNMIRILRTLKKTDKRIVEYFKLKTIMKYDKEKYILINEYFDEKKYSKEINLFEWQCKIEEKIWVLIDTYNLNYQNLIKWVDDNNRLPLMTSDNETEMNLGIWCFEKREKYKTGKIKKEQIIGLNNIPTWKWEISEKLFTCICCEYETPKRGNYNRHMETDSHKKKMELSHTNRELLIKDKTIIFDNKKIILEAENNNICTTIQQNNNICTAIQQNNIKNINNKNQKNIIINLTFFGEEEINCLSLHEINYLLTFNLNLVISLTKIINLNIDKPQYHNIMYPGLQYNQCLIYNKKSLWISADINTVIDFLVDAKIKHLYDIMTKMPFLDEKTRNKFYDSIKEWDKTNIELRKEMEIILKSILCAHSFIVKKTLTLHKKNILIKNNDKIIIINDEICNNSDDDFFSVIDDNLSVIDEDDNLCSINNSVYNIDNIL